MFYQQKFDTFIRIYDDVGYISNNSNFIDRVTSSSGAVFLSVLTRSPKELETLVSEIARRFTDIDNETLKKDIIDFYAILEKDGFIVSGKSKEELDKKDKRFSYKQISPKTIKDNFTPAIFRASKETQDYLEGYFKNKPQLVRLQIELTSRCNERCIHCYIPHQNKTTDIEDSLFYDTLNQCRDLGVLNITLSGGEPLSHPHFLEYLRKAKEYDFSINVLSNLTLLNNDIIAEMKANRLSSVQVSLYSMDAAVHDSITKLAGSFEKTKSAILKLKANDIPVQISCPTMKQNKDSFRDVITWASKNKMRALTDYIMMARYDHTTDNLENRLTLDEVGTIINDVITNDILYRTRIAMTDFEKIENQNQSNDTICGVCVSSLGMVANGNIYPCAGWQGYILGNIKEQSLRDMWKNSPRVNYLRGLRKKDFPECLDCRDKNFCAMCMVRNANENQEGDPLKINRHFCQVAALNHKIVLEWQKKSILTCLGKILQGNKNV